MNHIAAVLGCDLAETRGASRGSVAQRIGKSRCYQEAIAPSNGNWICNSVHGQPAITARDQEKLDLLLKIRRTPTFTGRVSTEPRSPAKRYTRVRSKVLCPFGSVSAGPRSHSSARVFLDCLLWSRLSVANLRDSVR